MGDASSECRICLSGADEDELLSGICACRGTQGHVHARCLAEWQASSASAGKLWSLWRCSVCHAAIDPRARRATLRRALPLLLRGLASADWWPALAGAVLAAAVAVVLHHGPPRPLESATPVWGGSEPNERAPLTAAGEASWRGTWWGAFHEPSGGPVTATGGSLVLWNSSLLVFGGWDDRQGARGEMMWASPPLDQLLELQAVVWAPVPLSPRRGLEVQSAGVAPLELTGHSASFVPAGPGRRARHFPRGYVLVFGGVGMDGPSGRVLLFDLEAERWALDPELVTGEAPPARSCHSATAVAGPEIIWVVGGRGDGKDLDDGIWPFDAARLRWLPVLPHPLGLAAGGGHSAVATRGHVLFFGGGDGGANDLLALRVKTGPCAACSCSTSVLS
ncbi:unnamed protein product [Prorocentrum cordatum]|uniref:RING-CH-type domain-containing protein n=1 Tax=Prorocentrum cordatum TaxID=2364126 RepID=A0ABN9XZL0_9DINO|nr:unnamed protein product [Polarella glacialis]